MGEFLVWGPTKHIAYWSAGGGGFGSQGERKKHLTETIHHNRMNFRWARGEIDVQVTAGRGMVRRVLPYVARKPEHCILGGRQKEAPAEKMAKHWKQNRPYLGAGGLTGKFACGAGRPGVGGRGEDNALIVF